MEPREVQGLGSWPFDPDCYVLLQTLDFVVRQLPGGFALRPFGSFVSGTAVKPAVLDLAIYEERPSVRPAPGLRIDPVESLCDLLLHRFPERFQLLQQRGPGQRILATSFGRPSSRQELLLFQGDLLTGEMDLTLQYLLPLHPEAVAMVKTLKRWACRCRLHQPGEGCFQWTLLVVFFLQQQGFLPPLEEFKRGEVPRLQPDPRELRELIFEFADFAISIWSRPPPRPSINIWKGRLDPVEASVPLTVPGDRTILEELRRLRQEVGNQSRGLHRLGESGQLARQNLMRQFPDHDITGRTSSTPPPVARGRAPQDAREIKPASSSMSRASSVAPLTAAASTRPQPPRSRWHIDESWVAYRTCQGRVVETVQLNPEEQGQLTREGWAQRFERREWQVHLGKITSEYERWASHWLRHGRSEGDPVTPRAVTQSSKAAFEAQYLNWRVKLHSNPPA